MQNNKVSILPWLTKHFLGISFILSILVLIRYPFFINSDYFFAGDEALLAGTIMRLLNGEPIDFYFPTATTFGLTIGLSTIPFVWIWGPTSLAYNFPATIFYSLYLWTTYQIARILIPRSAYMVLIMLIFTSNYVTFLSSHNWAHIPAAFFGNLIFLLFIKINSSNKVNNSIIFAFFFIIGLAIYTYTYSLLFILTISILFVLSHPLWNQIRENLSITALKYLFKNKKTKHEKICLFLDILLILFFVAVIFSYIFGGFGIDIGGYSIIQINQFNKAAIQLLVIIILRILINPADAIKLFHIVKSKCAIWIEQKKQNKFIIGTIGFLLGISPRIASILMGKTDRGGQGHDVDFLPTKIIAHFLDLLAIHGPIVLGLDINKQIGNFDSITITGYIFIALFMALISIVFISAFSFISKNRVILKNLGTLKGMPFNPTQIILLMPILVILANIIVQNGAEPRYLFPLFGVSALWVCIFVDRIKTKYKWVPITVLTIWMGYYSLSNYFYFQKLGVIKENKVVKFDKHYYHDIVDFLEDKEIKVGYSEAYFSEIVSYLSGSKINICEFSVNPSYNLINRRESALASPTFAILAKNKQAEIYKEFLREKEIRHKTTNVSGYDIFWEFSGNETEINRLRYLIQN